MAVDERFRDMSFEPTSEEQPIKPILAADCPHHNSKIVNTRKLPLGGIQQYYLCFDCQHQWQTIEEVPEEGNSK